MNRRTCASAAAVSMFRVPVTFTGKNGSTDGEAPIRPAAWMTTSQPRAAALNDAGSVTSPRTGSAPAIAAVWAAAPDLVMARTW
jgi:hypothetical protein